MSATTLQLNVYHKGVLSTTLAALTGSADGHTIVITGHTTKGDGGQGLARWDATDSSTTDDGGTVWGAGVGRWKRVFSRSIVEPGWFGAKGDGSTNDTVAIQLTIASLATYSGIDFGSRTYYLGTRTGASDAALQLKLDTLSDKTLSSNGATFTLQTTNEVSGYGPVMFRLIDCHRIGFVGRWNFVDTKSWSTYASYGQTLSSMPPTWIGLSGAYAISIYERCTDLTFGDLRFENTRYGLGVNHSGAGGTAPADADRSYRISVASIHADDVQYALGLFENGDDFTCPSLVTLNCMRGFLAYGVTNVKVTEHKRNSVRGFGSFIARKARDTANINFEMFYESTDGYPYQPLGVELAPVAATGNPYIKGCHCKLTCKLTTVDAARERQYAVQLAVYDTAGVESDYTTTAGAFRGLVLDIDKGEFEAYLGVSPVSDTTTNYEKIGVRLITRNRTGGTYDTSPGGVLGNEFYKLARKVAVEAPVIYEFFSSDTVDAGTVVYPVSGWGPWQDSTPSNASLTDHTCTWRWVRNGALVQYEMVLTLGSGTIPAGSWYFRLPYVPSLEGGAAPPLQEFGSVHVLDASSGDVYKGFIRYNGSSFYPTARLRVKDVGGTITHLSQDITSTAPFTFATGDIIRVTCTYLAGSTF